MTVIATPLAILILLTIPMPHNNAYSGRDKESLPRASMTTVGDHKKYSRNTSIIIPTSQSSRQSLDTASVPRGDGRQREAIREGEASGERRRDFVSRKSRRCFASRVEFGARPDGVPVWQSYCHEYTLMRHKSQHSATCRLRYR